MVGDRGLGAMVGGWLGLVLVVVCPLCYCVQWLGCGARRLVLPLFGVSGVSCFFFHVSFFFCWCFVVCGGCDWVIWEWCGWSQVVNPHDPTASTVHLLELSKPGKQGPFNSRCP